MIVPAELRVTYAESPESDPNGSWVLPSAELTAESVEKILVLAHSGQKSEAVRLICETFRVEQATAEHAVDRLAEGEPVSLPALIRSTTTASDQQPTTIDLSPYRGRILTCGILLVLTIGLTAVVPIVLTAVLPSQIIKVVEVLDPEAAATIGPAIQFNLAPPFTNSASPTPGLISQVFAFGQEGSGAGYLIDPREISLDASGNIYIADHGDGRVQRFNPQGEYQIGWITSPGDYTFGMDVQRNGTVYSIVQGDLYIYQGSTGELLQVIEPDPYFNFEDIAAGADGGLVLVADNDTLVWMDGDGTPLRSAPDVISKVEPDSELNARIALDGLGNVYLLGRFTNSVFKYNSQGDYQSRFGSDGDEPGQFRAPYAIAVDNLGNIYVSDIKGIQVFDSTGRYLALIEPPRVAFGIDFDDRNNLFIVTNQPQMVKYELNMP